MARAGTGVAGALGMQNMRARVQHEHELSGHFVRRMVHTAREASERTGEAMGVLAAPVFALTSALRGARTFHPCGDCADAEVTISDGTPPELLSLATRLCGMAFVRFSDALTKGKARWPDVLGCALRFGDDAGDPAVTGNQDLLFATIKRPWTMAFSPFTTKVDDYFANDYFTVSPFSIPTNAPLSLERVYFRLRPSTKEPGALMSREAFTGPPSTVRTSSGRWERAARGRPERRRQRLERTIATGASRFVLGVADSPWGPFAPLVDVQLVSVRLHDPAQLRFDPFRSGRGIEPQGFVHALRRGVYTASQRARASAR